MSTSKGRIGCLEKCLCFFTLTLIAQLLPHAVQMWVEWPKAGRQTPARKILVTPSGRSFEIAYWVYLPQDYSSRQRWPLLLYLHGSGGGDDKLKLAGKHGPPALIAGGKQMPMIVASPQCPAGSDWDCDELLALVAYLQERFSLDRQRLYVAGFSMGGSATWKLAAASSAQFAAAIPVSGAVLNSDLSHLEKVAIWAFHGANDTIVPLESSQKLVGALLAKGSNVRQTIYPDEGHQICDLVFARDDLYEWLLQQQRAQ